MPNQIMSQVYTKLLNEGPQPGNEVGSLNPSLRRDGVTKFNPRSRAAGRTAACGRTKAVYYIDGKHNPETVIRTWLEVNEDLIRGTDMQIHHRICAYGEEFKRASREVLDGPLIHENAGGAPDMGGECPFCGEEYTHSLPRHLPCEGVES